MSVNHYDLIVIGLGVMGSAAAYHAAKAGQRVLALEQFSLDHNLGSSYGESRIIRYAYTHPTYIQMAHQSFALWRALEAESGQSLMTRTGGLDFGSPASPSFAETKQALAAAEIAYELLDSEAANQRFPQFKLPAHMQAIYQADAAFLRASACVLAQAEQAARHGATLQTNMPVTAIRPLDNGVEVVCGGQSYHANKLILTAGVWAGRNLAALGLNLPLQPTREQVLLFKTTRPALFEPARCPVFIYHDQPWYYGIPNVDGVGFKVAIHCNGENVDPNAVVREVDEAYKQKVTAWAAQYMPLVGSEIAAARTCLYTMTPDEHFIIDNHPQHPQIVFAAGFSGHGFKFGPLVGQWLAQMANGQTPAGYDRGLFGAGRFART
jgi:monomeric sarcosine oxidase